LTHGFALDGEGRKMSKSLGNVISPIDVADRRGADILRLWVSMIDFLEDMRLSQEILDRNAEAYRKIRNTFRYLMGNLNGFDAARDSVAYDQMEEIDRWALHQLETLRARLVAAYDSYQYSVVYHGLQNFCAVTLSSLYLDILKDRLYTFPRRSRERRSAQTVLYRLAMDLCLLMAPILCFTAEEVWQEMEAFHGRERWAGSTVHAESFPAPLAMPEDKPLLDRYDRLFALRMEVSKALERSRADKKIGSSLEAKVRIDAPHEAEEFLRSFGDGLRFLFITSGVEFGDLGDPGPGALPPPGIEVQVLRADGTKCERCWHYTSDVGSNPSFPGACGRCAAALDGLLSGPEPA